MERQKNKGSRRKKRGGFGKAFFFFFFWCKVCPEHPVFRTEIFLCAWSLVYMTAFCNMPFWNMTKTVETAAYFRDK